MTCTIRTIRLLPFSSHLDTNVAATRYVSVFFFSLALFKHCDQRFQSQLLYSVCNFCLISNCTTCFSFLRRTFCAELGTAYRASIDTTGALKSRDLTSRDVTRRHQRVL